MADGNGYEVARAYVTIVPSLQGAQKTIATELGVATETASAEAGEKSGKKLGESISKGLKTTAKVIGAAMATVTAGAVASSKAFVDTAKQVADYGDTVDKQSQKVGLSAKTWQEYDYVMKIAGADMQSMTTGMKTLTNQIDAAKNGNKDAVERFKALGISMKDLKNLSREDLFKKTISGLQGMAEGTDRAALANKLFGKSGQDLTPLLNMTSEETQGLIDKANDLGMVMSDEGVKASADFKDSLTTLQGTMQGVKNNIMTQFMPGLTAITEGLADVFAGKGSGKLTEGISALMEKLKEMAPDVLSAISEVGKSVIQGLGPLLPDLVSTVFSLLTQAITTVSSMMPQLMPSIISGIKGAMQAVMTALPIIIQGLTELVMSLVTWLSSGNNVQQMVSGVVALVTQMVNSFAMILPVLIPAIVTIITEVAKAMTEPDNVQLLLDAVLTLIGALAVGIINSLPILVDAVKAIMSNLGELLSRFFEWAVPIAAEGIAGIVNTVKNWLNAVKTFILNIINGIKTAILSWINNLKQAFISGFTAIKEKISSILSNIGGFVKDVIDKIKELPSKVVSIGKDLVTGLWNGINDKIKWVKDKIKGMGESITKAIKGVFGIHSPSKVFAEVGSFLAEGLGIGYEKEMQSVKKDMLSASDGLTASMTAQVTAYGVDRTAQGKVSNYNGGAVTINVYGAEGQSVKQLAQEISYRFEDMTNRRAAVYA